jgi:CRP-like cAMP-binding protein
MNSKASGLMKCINEISFFDEFSNKEKGVLTDSVGIFTKYDKKGTVIFSDGNKGQELFVILEGVVSITRGCFKSDREKPITIAKLQKGSVFGEISLLSDHKRTTGAITESPLVIVMVVDKKTLESFDLGIQKIFHKQMISILINRLDEMNRKYINSIG